MSERDHDTPEDPKPVTYLIPDDWWPDMPAKPEQVVGPPSLPAQMGQPDHCHNCGAGPESLSWDPADGWCCSACHATDADET